MNKELNKGYLLAISAFVWWGITPFYFKAIHVVSAGEILAHRIIWSALMLAIYLGFSKGQLWSRTKAAIKKHGYLLGLAALLLSGNWLIYIYAVVEDHILEASLGYYINPLINVLLGGLFFKEKLSKYQKIAVMLAFIGVLQEIIRFQQIPLISISLALSFGFYGLIRKKADISGSEGLFIETLLLLPLALAYLFNLWTKQQLIFAHQTLTLDGLLFAAGIITTLPLIWFIGASKRLKYATIGLFQYIGPTIMGILGYVVYNEGFPPGRLITFALVWSGLALTLFENFSKKTRA